MTIYLYNHLSSMKKIILILLSAISILNAQQFGILKGTVVNKENNKPLPFVNILIKGTLIGTSSDFYGNYAITKIKPGTYTVVASIVGFKKTEIANVVIYSGKETIINIQLEPSAVQISQVVITAGKREQAFNDIPTSVSVLEAREIYTRNIVTVDDVFRYIPGVSVIESQISIRGSSGYSKGVGSRALVLIDGIPLITGDTGEPIYESMPTNFIERIEVLKGASSALYGSGAMGGVINIITQKIPDRPLIFTKIYGGFYDKPLYKQWRWTESTRFLNGFVLGHSRKFNNTRILFALGRTEDDGYRKNTRLQRWNLYSKSEIQYTPSKLQTISISYLDQRRNNFLYWKSLDSALIPPDDQLDDRVISKRFALSSLFKNIVTDKFIYSIKCIWFHTDWRNDVALNGDRSRSNFIDLETQFNYQPDEKNILTTGIEISGNSVLSDIFGNRAGLTVATYLQDEYKFNEEFKITSGARFDVSKLESLKTFFQLNPKLGLAYNLKKNVSLRFSVGRAFRSSTVSEAFTSTTASGIIVIPNPHLKPERSWSFEVGTNLGISDNILLDAAIFQSYYENLIEPKFVSPFTGQFVNITKAQIRGLELVLNSALIRDMLNLNLAFTYIYPEDIQKREILKFRSRSLFYLNLLFKYSLYEIGIDFRSLSKIEKIDEEFSLYIRDSERRVPVRVMDFHIAQNFILYELPIKISFHINNLFNYNYVELIGNLAPIRNFIIRLETTI